MATHTVTKVKGVHSAPNQLESVPEGSLAASLNCVTQFKDVVQSRRGQEFLDGEFGTVTDRSNEGFFYRDRLFTHYSTSTIASLSGTTWTDLSGSYTPPDAATLRMKFMEAAKNLYWNTDVGIKCLDGLSGTVRSAGVPRAYWNSPYLLNAASGWMEQNNQVAYRVVFGIRDQNGNVKLGPPSERAVFKFAGPRTVPAGDITRYNTGPPHEVTAVVDNDWDETAYIYNGEVNLFPGEANFPAGDYDLGGADDTSITWYDAGVFFGVTTVEQTLTLSDLVTPIIRFNVPAGVDTNYFFRVYRSYLSGDADVPPEDDMYLVAEGPVTATGSGTAFMQHIDYTPEAFLQSNTPLYTNPNDGDGLVAGRESPPIAKDIIYWRDRAFYFNTTDKHRFRLHLLGVGSPDGVQNGDTITIGDHTYTATTGGSAGTSFGIVNDAGKSLSLNIELTARELIDRINANDTTLCAFYSSSKNDPAGVIAIEERAPGGDTFYVYGSRTGTWFPTLTTVLSGAQASDNSRRENGFSYSIRGQPEAVPLTNNESVGVVGAEILRAVKGRDRIFVFMDDSTIHTISGTGPFRIDPLDETAQLIGPDTVKAHNGQVLAFTWQGVVSVSDAGVRILSAPIEDQLLELIGSSIDNVKLRAFAVSYESDRQYQLWLPSDDDDEFCTQAWVYNSLYDTWMRWTGNRSWGVVRKSNNRLYLGDGDTNKVRVERKDYSRSDFCDEDIDVSIVSYDGTEVVLTTTGGLNVGDLLYQSDSVRALIVAIDDDADSMTLSSSENWTVGAAVVKVAIECEVKWSPVEVGTPSIMKRFREFTIHFKQFFTNVFEVTFDSDRAPTERSATISAPGFGLASFGQGRFGSDDASRNRRQGVHPDQQQANWIRPGFGCREAWSVWVLEGFSLEYETISERGGS